MPVTRSILGIAMVLAACSRAFVTDPVAAIEPSGKNGFMYSIASFNSSEYKAGVWVSTNEQIFEYADNRLQAIQSRSWDESNQQWGAVWKTLYFRDSLLRLASWYYVQPPLDTASAIVSQTYRYNAAGKIASSAAYQNSGSTRKVVSYTAYEYDGLQRLSKQVGCNAQSLDCDSNITEYTYPNDSSYTTATRQIIGGTETGSTRSVVTLNKSGNLLSSTTESYRNNVLIAATRSIYKYNPNGWLSEAADEQLKSGAWKATMKTAYSYTEYDDSLLCNSVSSKDTGAGLFEYYRLRTKYSKQILLSNSPKRLRALFSGVKIVRSGERIDVISNQVVSGAYIVNSAGALIQSLVLVKVGEGVYESRLANPNVCGAKWIVIKFARGGAAEATRIDPTY